MITKHEISELLNADLFEDGVYVPVMDLRKFGNKNYFIEDVGGTGYIVMPYGMQPPRMTSMDDLLLF